MHRVVNRTPDGLFTDHINWDKLDNRKQNLRTATKSQNEHNTGVRKNNKSGHKGIIWDARREHWRVEKMVNYKRYYLGSYQDLEKAIKVRDAAEQICKDMIYQY
jgi:hypothetical protein